MRSPYIKIFYNFLALLGLIGYLILLAKAQYTLVPDSIVYQQATHYALAHYRMHVGVQASIYQGKGFVNIHQKVDGHQFFESEDWEKGTIHYDGLTYSEVEMKYDVLTEQHRNFYSKITRLE